MGDVRSLRVLAFVVSCWTTAALATPFAYVIAGDGTGAVFVIDTETNTVATTIPLTEVANGVAVNRAGSRVYLAGPNGVLQVLDTNTNTIRTTVPVGRGAGGPTGTAQGVALNPAGTRVYVAAAAEDKLYVVDATTDTVVTSVQVEGRPTGVSASDSRVYVVNTCAYASGCANGSVSVIEARGNTVIATIPVGESPSGIGVSSISSRAYVSHRDGLSVIDTSSNTVVDTIGVPWGQSVLLNAAGTRAYVPALGSDPGFVSIVDMTTNGVLGVVRVGRYPLDAALTPSGTRLYVTNYFDGTFSVIETATNSVATFQLGYSPHAFGGYFIGGPCDGDPECDDSNPCTTDSCDPVNGCDHVPVDCGDGDDCTGDSCAVASGCTYAPVLGCVPGFTSAARRCQSGLAGAAVRFATTLHKSLSRCLDTILTAGAGTPVAAGTCARDLDTADPRSLISRARQRAERQIMSKCSNVTPTDINTPCDIGATTIPQSASCVLDQYLEHAQGMIAATYRDVCAMLPAVSLGTAYPEVCAAQ